MKRAILEKLSESELNAYAGVLGIDAVDSMSIADKIDAIEDARKRTATITIMGLTLSVPIKRFHDKRVSDALDKFDSLSDTEVQQLFEDIVGKQQMKKITKHVTDADGTIDVDAMGLFIARVFTDQSLKNF